jgi:hypothetical protein
MNLRPWRGSGGAGTGNTMARVGVFEADFLDGTDFEAGDFEALIEGEGDEKGMFGFEFSEFRKFSVDLERVCREVLGGVAITV